MPVFEDKYLQKARSVLSLPDEDLLEGKQQILASKPQASDDEVLSDLVEYTKKQQPELIKQALQPSLQESDIQSLYDIANQRAREKAAKKGWQNTVIGLGNLIAGQGPKGAIQPFEETEEKTRQEETAKLRDLLQQRRAAPEDAMRRLGLVKGLEGQQKTAKRLSAESPVYGELLKKIAPGLTTEGLETESKKGLLEPAMKIYELGEKQKSAEAKREADERARQESGAFKQAMLDLRRGQQETKFDEATNKEITKLGFKLQDSGIEKMDDTLSDIETILDSLPKTEKGTPKDIPGYGRGASLVPQALISGKGKELRQALQQLSNVQLKQRSGAAVTAQEYARFMREFGTGKFESEEALLNGIKRLRKAIDRDKNTLFSSVRPEAVKEYQSRQGKAPVSAPQEKAVKKMLRNKRTGEVKVIYADGTEEIRSGQ